MKRWNECAVLDCRCRSKETSRYCDRHKCIHKECDEWASDNGSRLRCDVHCCIMTFCSHPKVPGFNYCQFCLCKSPGCPLHKTNCKMHKCVKFDCHSVRVPGSDYCSFHKCRVQSCSDCILDQHMCKNHLSCVGCMTDPGVEVIVKQQMIAIHNLTICYNHRQCSLCVRAANDSRRVLTLLCNRNCCAIKHRFRIGHRKYKKDLCSYIYSQYRVPEFVVVCIQHNRAGFRAYLLVLRRLEIFVSGDILVLIWRALIAV